MICCLPSASGLVPQISPSWFQASSTWSMLDMSAIEQPAERFGSVTVCSGVERMSAVSAMKCTPQNTMWSASGHCVAFLASWNESPT